MKRILMAIFVVLLIDTLPWDWDTRKEVCAYTVRVDAGDTLEYETRWDEDYLEEKPKEYIYTDELAETLKGIEDKLNLILGYIATIQESGDLD